MDYLALLSLMQVFQGLLIGLAGIFLLWLIFLGLPAIFNGPPFVSSHKDKVAAMMKLAALKTGEKVADLGSGDGRLLLAAARDGCRTVGYEINIFLVWLSRLKALIGRPAGRVEVRWADFWRADLSDADVVFIYGFAGIMEKAAKKFQDELKPGARVVSLRYDLPGWPPKGESAGAKLYIKS